MSSAPNPSDLTPNIEKKDYPVIRDKLCVNMQHGAYDFINFFDLSNR
ncbi:hypothetical protein HUB98_20045 [Paenibacillus barcinonensis]|uniref:Uncharacterized protein n=1 Tax=Paenibacillus barcinonensis TaxID=198119 RepID=A0ABX6Q8X1_PAEBA|nr:hypothetical protein [Paenibacillus barcinonensis]QKS58310.1 hypothetical protein HUB98_20045 [Paenibacillus barcinonensis]